MQKNRKSSDKSSSIAVISNHTNIHIMSNNNENLIIGKESERKFKKNLKKADIIYLIYDKNGRREKKWKL